MTTKKAKAKSPSELVGERHFNRGVKWTIDLLQTLKVSIPPVVIEVILRQAKGQK
jgi:hypothetical protein